MRYKHNKNVGTIALNKLTSGKPKGGLVIINSVKCFFNFYMYIEILAIYFQN
jgi:hypothetical protein